MATTTTSAAAAISNVDAHLEVTPENEICFTLRKADTSPRVTLTLKHPDPDSSPVAFKVRLYFDFFFVAAFLLVFPLRSVGRSVGRIILCIFAWSLEGAGDAHDDFDDL
jgi:hypothetical protein